MLGDVGMLNIARCGRKRTMVLRRAIAGWGSVGHIFPSAEDALAQQMSGAPQKTLVAILPAIASKRRHWGRYRATNARPTVDVVSSQASQVRTAIRLTCQDDLDLAITSVNVPQGTKWFA